MTAYGRAYHTLRGKLGHEPTMAQMNELRAKHAGSRTKKPKTIDVSIANKVNHLIGSLADALSIDPAKRTHGMTAIKKIRRAADLTLTRTAPPKPKTPTAAPSVAGMSLGAMIRLAQGPKVS